MRVKVPHRESSGRWCSALIVEIPLQFVKMATTELCAIFPERQLVALVVRILDKLTHLDPFTYVGQLCLVARQVS
jgi:hypothetical protein